MNGVVADRADAAVHKTIDLGQQRPAGGAQCRRVPFGIRPDDVRAGARRAIDADENGVSGGPITQDNATVTVNGYWSIV